jgi:serine protease inhibitor
MTALLPPPARARASASASASVSAGCALPSQKALSSITGQLNSGGAAGDTMVALPKVNLSVGGSDGDMGQVLKRLGMSVAFSPAADFTRLSVQAGPIGFVQQAATLRVGERGTVGAAAAAVGIEPSSAQIAPRTVTFNRPYLLLVSAKSTGEPLFLAQVANPAAS